MLTLGIGLLLIFVLLMKEMNVDELPHYIKVLIILFLAALIGTLLQWSPVISLVEQEVEAEYAAGMDAAHGHAYFQVTSRAMEKRLLKKLRHYSDSGPGASLYVQVFNNMIGQSTIEATCFAYDGNDVQLTYLGKGPIISSHSALYWINLALFVPAVSTVECTISWSEKSDTLTMYDQKNVVLGYLYMQWSIDERGFSLWNNVAEKFELYYAW